MIIYCEDIQQNRFITYKNKSSPRRSSPYRGIKEKKFGELHVQTKRRRQHLNVTVKQYAPKWPAILKSAHDFETSPRFGTHPRFKSYIIFIY